jgi:hypothetical protein
MGKGRFLVGLYSRARARSLLGTGLLIGVVTMSAALGGDPPTELAPTVRINEQGRISWALEQDADYYNVYKGRLTSGQDWTFGHVCMSLAQVAPWVTDVSVPGRGELAYYLVTKESASGEGPLGFSSDGTPRPAPLPCVDSDGDRIADVIDNCPDYPNAKQLDTDFDSIGDVCDDDDDNDGLADYDEYILGTSRVDWDTDGDGLGDGDEVYRWGSDPLSTDTDGDGFDDGDDNCPVFANPTQADLDSDGVGDICDNCPLMPNGEQQDYDQDQVGSLCDNCPYLANADQTDDNYNGVGDACETVALTEVLDGGGAECVGTTVAIDAASVGQVAAGHVAGTNTAAEVGFVNGAADE